MYRVKEYNDIYECGWIYVSNAVSQKEAEYIRAWRQMRSPHLLYTIDKVDD